MAPSLSTVDTGDAPDIKSRTKNCPDVRVSDADADADACPNAVLADTTSAGPTFGDWSAESEYF